MESLLLIFISIVCVLNLIFSASLNKLVLKMHNDTSISKSLFNAEKNISILDHHNSENKMRIENLEKVVSVMLTSYNTMDGDIH